MKTTNKLSILLHVTLLFSIVLTSLTAGFFLRGITGFAITAGEQLSPFDHVSEEAITVAEDKVLIDLQGKSVAWSRFTDTNSMDPFLDDGQNGLAFIPKTPEDIHVGDVVSYVLDEQIIVHRVIFIGQDATGWYAILKGDNVSIPDIDKVRFEQILTVYFGVIF